MTAIILAGGTAAMIERAGQGVVPAPRGVLQSRLELVELGPVRLLEWGAKPSMHLSNGDVIDIAHAIRREHEASPGEGVVLVQGTDSMEETGVALDLLVDGLVVVTGAMDTMSSHSFDGIRNIQDAVAVARCPLLVKAGTIVVMNGDLHTARDVTKVRTTGHNAFESPHVGVLGRVVDGGIALEGTLPPRSVLRADKLAEPIPILMATLANDGFEVEPLLEAGAIGFVVSAAGTGQTHPGLLNACKHAIRRGVPVLVTTRVMAGRFDRTYGYAGGGRDWVRIGAIPSGYLSPLKARIALSVGLGAGLSGPEVAALLSEYQPKRPHDQSLASPLPHRLP